MSHLVRDAEMNLFRIRGLFQLEAGFAKLQIGSGADRIADAHLFAQAEQSAKRQKLKARSLFLLLWVYYIFMD